MERRTESNKSWNPVPPPASSRRMAGSMAPRASSSSGAAQDGSNRGGIEWGMETPALECGVLKFWGFAGQQKDGNAPRDR
jgi:hypothetical protein